VERSPRVWRLRRAENANGAIPIVASTSPAEYLARWLNRTTPIRAPTTIRGSMVEIKRISATLGTIQLDKLTAQHLDQAYRDRLADGLHPSTVHHLHRVASGALRQAVKWGFAPTVVTGRATPPPRRPEPKQVPAPAVIQRLIAGAEDRRQSVLGAAIAVAATTGLRRGELAGLRWDDVDLDAGRLQVRLDALTL
jgi:integrase